MGSLGDAYDNAMCESFFATLECELLDRHRFKTQTEARRAVFEFIESTHRWRVRCGFSFDRPRLAAKLGPEKAIQTDRSRNQRREGQGGTEALTQNIIPFDAASPVLSR